MLVRRILAMTAILAGSLGVALSVVAVLQTRATGERLVRDIPRAIDGAESIVGASIEQADIAAEFLQTTRNRLVEIQATVEEFSQGRRGRLTALLDSLDVDVIERLERAEEFVRSLQAGLQSAGSMVLLFESLPFVVPRISPSSADGGDLKNLASEVIAFNETLERIADALAEIRTEGRAGPEQTALLHRALRIADQEILGVQNRLEDLSDELDTLKAALSSARTASVRRLQRGTMFVLLFFACFAASQINLAWRGVCSLRVGRAPAHD